MILIECLRYIHITKRKTIKPQIKINRLKDSRIPRIDSVESETHCVLGGWAREWGVNEGVGRLGKTYKI